MINVGTCYFKTRAHAEMYYARAGDYDAHLKLTCGEIKIDPTGEDVRARYPKGSRVWLDGDGRWHVETANEHYAEIALSDPKEDG